MVVKEIGKNIYVDTGTHKPILKRLEGKGLILRERSKEDERQVSISITSDGQRLKKQAMLIPEKMSSCINLATEEAATLYALLYKLLEQLGGPEKC